MFVGPSCIATTVLNATQTTNKSTVCVFLFKLREQASARHSFNDYFIIVLAAWNLCAKLHLQSEDLEMFWNFVYLFCINNIHNNRSSSARAFAAQRLCNVLTPYSIYFVFFFAQGKMRWKLLICLMLICTLHFAQFP